MKNKRLINAFLFLFVLMIGVLLAYINIPKSISTSILQSNIKSTRDTKILIEKNFKLNFTLKKNEHQTITTYVIDEKDISIELVQEYKKIFKIDGDWTSMTYKDICVGEAGTIEVHKGKGLIKFIKNNIKPKNNLINYDDAKDIALKFLDDYSLSIIYDDIIVINNEGNLHVKLITKIGKYKNLSFQDEIIIDKYGNILEYYIYKINYKNYKDVKAISMKESFLYLPQEFHEKVYLNSCELVYIYENSILQPGYMYLGTTQKGNVIEIFIEGAIF